MHTNGKLIDRSDVDAGNKKKTSIEYIFVKILWMTSQKSQECA